jgi:photosystem II stability/assembly factor-like uncharacterized protein
MKKLIFSFVIVFYFTFISDIKAQSGWFWQNPLPQGNTLHDVSFVGDYGFAVGKAGTVLYTHNAGINWTLRSIDTGDEILSVVTFDSLTAIVSAGGNSGKIYKTTDAGNTWLNQSSGYTGNLVDISFCDEQNGFIATGYIRLLHTANGGDTWEIINVPYPFTRISVINPNTAFAITGNNAEIYKTTDGGYMWIDQTVSTLDDLMDIYFIDGSNGWATGWNGIMLHTADGGLNWGFQSSNTSNDLYHISFSDASNGFAVGVYGTVINTTNGGLTWLVQSSGLPDFIQLWSVSMINFNNAVCVGADGAIIKTTDGGTNWLKITNIGTEYIGFNAVHFCNSTFGATVGYVGIIWTTTNAGNSWNANVSGTTSDLYAVYFKNPLLGFVAGDNGTLLKTTDSGVSWWLENLGVSNVLYSIYFWDENIGYISGNGVLYKTTDAGSTWTSISNIPPSPFYKLFFTNVNTGYAVTWSYQKVYKTTDGGLHWFVQSTGMSGFDDYYGVGFYNENTGVVVGGKIYRTTNAGSSWEIINSSAEAVFNDLKIIENRAYAVTEDGRIFYSSDYGLSWEEQIRITDLGLKAICFPAYSVGYIVGTAGKILKTVNGGGIFIATFLTGDANAGTQTLPVEDISGFSIGDEIIINPGGSNEESNTITGFGSIILQTPLIHDHLAGEPVVTANPTSVKEEGNQFPVSFTLYQNYPNPFNPSTVISYQLPVSSDVTLKVYDILGNEIATLVNEYKPAGEYEVEFNVGQESIPVLASGVYFYQLRVGGFVQTKKMVLLR